jgi:phospholipid/cholesterol/gamma-HCH transport system permease protein
MDMQATKDGWITASATGRAAKLAVGGTWEITQLRALSADTDKAAATLLVQKPDRVEIDLAELTSLDSSGAWILFAANARLADANIQTEFTNVRPAYRGLLERVERSASDVSHREPDTRPLPVIRELSVVGAMAFGAGAKAMELLSFFGMTILKIIGQLARPWRIQFKATIKHIELAGLNAMPIVGLLAGLIGAVLVIMGAQQLRQFGAEIFAVNLLGIAVLREMGVLITSIIIAGRSASAFTAQIGTMQVNQEIDAMRTIGLDPIDVLVLPRMLAMIISLPLLTIFADMMGIAVGALLSIQLLGITFDAFYDQFMGAVDLTAFLVGFLKAPLFAYAIAMVGCYEGMKVTGSAESVGLHTTMAVVEAIFLVIALDAVIAVTLSIVGI